MSEPLLGESTAQDEQRSDVIARPSVSAGLFWINPYRTESLLAKSSAEHRQCMRYPAFERTSIVVRSVE
jgi:hypothetical protein